MTASGVRHSTERTATNAPSPTPQDWSAVWPFFRRVIAAGETFTYPTDLTSDTARDWWLLDAPNRTVVAVDEAAGTVLGTAKMNNNQWGNGGHVASASFLVDPDHAGRGTGRALCVEALRWAREQGFRAMQFNAVVASNAPAVGLYRSLGFTVVGTVPEGFHHPRHGYVDLYVMHRPL
ncbi:GNAT family N-acetyltransferase [Kitasatospora setae]|uniref:GNAT family N-acetyltransferase n=1 Tax=Kitasatospora setae TaxID=2066 RepID=UPI00068ED3C2|nr:GNAT family N-acetyltransferase [Kitasatospora setae]